MFKAKIAGDKLDFYAKDYVKNTLQPYDEHDVFVNITPFHEKRSIKQNNWYYGVAIPIIIAYLKETQGEKYSKEDINQYHLNEVIKPNFQTRAIFGKVCVIYDIKRTSEMDTVEFMDFKDKIQVYWAQRDLIIPDPNQTEFL